MISIVEGLTCFLGYGYVVLNPCLWVNEQPHRLSLSEALERIVTLIPFGKERSKGLLYRQKGGLSSLLFV